MYIDVAYTNLFKMCGDFECKFCSVTCISWDVTYNSEATLKKTNHFISHHLKKKINQEYEKKKSFKMMFA